MVEVEHLAASPSRSFAAVHANNGFVQLPTDFQRSTASGYRRVYSARPLKKSN